ncbi:MAG: YHS domain-containing protein [Desulfuromonadia bacterium]
MRLIQLLTWGILIYIGYRILMGFVQSRRQEKSHDAGGSAGTDESPTFQDPVCGRYITEDDAIIGRNGSERIHFCSRECLEEYRQMLERNSRNSHREEIDIKP